MKKVILVTTAGFFAFVLIVAAWMEFVHDRIFPKRFGVVEQGEIYRSAQLHPALIEDVLREYRIERVVDLQYWEEKPGIVAEKAAVERLGIPQFRFPLNGNGTGDIEQYVLAIEQIHEATSNGEPILVHCAAGAQRTGGVIAAYRTLVQGKPAREAVIEMTQYDWDPVDDRVLLEFLDEHSDYLASRLIGLGIIDAAPDPMPRFQEVRI